MAIPFKAHSQEKSSIYLKFMPGKTQLKSSESIRFDLHVYSDSLLKKVFTNLPTDSMIKISGDKGHVYKASVHITGYPNTDSYWRFDTVVVNFVKHINLELQPIQLKDVVIKADRESYKRGDTLIIPVDQIKTKPHSSANELLDKIPGFSVSSGGNVTAMGKKVNKIKVDGVEVFGGNPKATLENLRSDMLRDVEVANLTGESGTEVEINLKIKKDKKEGIYGEVYGQYGTRNRRNIGFKINQIQPSSFLNAFVNYNNQNQQVLTPNDYLQMVGFNNATSGTLGTQKLYYDYKLEDPLDNLNNLGDWFPFLDKGIKRSYSAGFNYTKRIKNLNWDSYVLGSADRNQFNENSTTTNYLGLLNSHDFKNSLTNLKNLNLTGQSNLKWVPNERNTVTGKLILQRRNIDNMLLEHTASSLYGPSDTLINNAAIDNEQDLSSGNTMGYVKGSWEHHYNIAAEKTSISAGGLINHTDYSNHYTNQINGSGSSFGDNNLLAESSNNYNYFANVQHSFPVSRKLLIDFRVNTLLSNNSVDRTTQNIAGSGALLYSPDLSINDFRIRNNQTAFQSFLFYKAGSLSVIAGLGALNTSYKVSSVDTLFDKLNRTALLPSFYINYVFNRSKISFKYLKEQTTPSSSNLLPVSDSTHIQQVIKGNPVLRPYLSNKFELNSDIFINGVGSVGLSVTYAKSDGPVIDDVTFNNGYFPLKTFTQDKNGQEITGTLSYFKFNPGKLFNPYLFIFYLWRKQYQQNGQFLTPVELSAISPQIGVKMTFNKEHSLNLSIQAMVNSSRQSDTSKSVSSRFNVELKDDNKIYNNLYYNFSTKWVMIYANSHTNSIKPVTNFILYQYLGKESKWQINYGVKNIFNVNDIKLINVGITQRTISSYNYLPRYFNLGVTYYPEKWKKSTTSN